MSAQQNIAASSPSTEQNLDSSGDLRQFACPSRAKAGCQGCNGVSPSRNSAVSISAETDSFSSESRDHQAASSSCGLSTDTATADSSANSPPSPRSRSGLWPPLSLPSTHCQSGTELEKASSNDACQDHSVRDGYALHCSGHSAAEYDGSEASPAKARSDEWSRDMGDSADAEVESWGASLGLPASLQQVAATDSPRTSASCEASETSEAWRRSKSQRHRWGPSLGVCLFGLTCLAGTFYGSLTCYLASYLRQVGLQNVAVREMLLVCALQGALQALATPLSVKLLSFLSLPLAALLSGWLVTGSLLLSAFLLSADVLTAHPFLFYCVYAGVGGLGAGLMHGVSLGGRQRPILYAGERKTGCSMSGLFFGFRCLSMALLPIVHSLFLNPDNLSPASVSPTGTHTQGGFGRHVHSRWQNPAPQQILGEGSWRQRERFYLQDEILARLPLLLMGTAAAFAVVQLVASLLLQQRERNWESECLPGEFIGCEVSVEEQSPLVTRGVPQTFYGGEINRPDDRLALSGPVQAAGQTSRLNVVVSTMNPADSGVYFDQDVIPSPRDDSLFTCVIVAMITAIQGMAFFLVQASWRFVGQEDFQISDHGVSYINAGSVAVILLFSAVNSPFFALKEDASATGPCHRDGNKRSSNRMRGQSPSTLPWLCCLSGLLLASEGFVATLTKTLSAGSPESLIRNSVHIGRWFEGSPLTTHALFFAWLSVVRILDAWTAWLLFPYAQTVLSLRPSRLLVLLCSAKAAGAGALAWITFFPGFYSLHGIGDLYGVVGVSLVIAGLVRRLEYG
ncbi:putative transmembrane protein [Toxoplasma gondii FOU]|uniref:Putative transmembrane protein n=2 Tax=Toxoplasma gondii TaxID=5811 RepID=A0A086L7P3_TOXGO|nr:putative transmembrane protein [Toxoplasma gondii FOU]PUA89813.1 putative transmembrane protein [Toxoplasma gondii TgCATBr9]